MTGEEQQFEVDLNEEAMDTDSNQVVPDSQEERSMVTTSTEVCTCFFLRFFKYYSLFNGVKNCERVLCAWM